MKTFFTTADAARRLNLTPAGVRQLTARGVLKIDATTPGGVRLYNPRRVDALVAKRARRIAASAGTYGVRVER
jgi:DNA-binding transcriptional MerR regulator